LGPRRTFAALAVLALAALIATAGTAVAFDGGAGTTPAAGTDVHAVRGNEGQGNQWQGNQWQESPGRGVGGRDAGGQDTTGQGAGGGATSRQDVWDHDGDWRGRNGPGAGSGFGSGGDVDVADVGSGLSPTGSDVNGSGAGIPPAPVEAPAVAASGPAPDAATAAPTSAATTVAATVAATDTVAAGAGGPGEVVPAPEATLVTASAPAGVEALDQLPLVGALGGMTDDVTPGRSAARVLSTGPGRSLLAFGLLLGVILVFLTLHRRTDRTDRKLAAARRGPEVARFK
jgi:hypothetical protein